MLIIFSIMLVAEAEVSTLLLFLMVAGIVITWFGFRGIIKLMAIVKHNELCKKQVEDWNQAWSNWRKTIFDHAFQEDTNGQLSRIFDAVSDCIEQVSKEEFKDAAVSVEEDSLANMNELEQLINRRKEEYR